jgi:hypothetical protein
MTHQVTLQVSKIQIQKDEYLTAAGNIGETEFWKSHENQAEVLQFKRAIATCRIEGPFSPVDLELIVSLRAGFVRVSFALTVGTLQCPVLVCQNGVQSTQYTDATGIWHVPIGKKLVLLSMQAEGNCLQAYTSPSGFTIMTICRATNGSQIGFPYMTELPQRSYMQNEIFTANSSWPAGIVLPSGCGVQPQTFNLSNPLPANSFVITYAGYFTSN